MRIFISLLLLLGISLPALAAELVQVPLGNSPTLGPPNAPVVIFEFIDFQ